MGVIEERYLPGRQHTDDAALDQWLRAEAPQTEAEPEPESWVDDQLKMSLTRTPEGTPQEPAGGGPATPSPLAYEEGVTRKSLEAPAPPAPAAEPPPASWLLRLDQDIATGLKEAPWAVLGGVRDALVNTADVILRYSAPSLPGVSEPAIGSGVVPAVVPEVSRPESLTGEVVRSAAQFMSVFLPIAGVTTPLRALSPIAQAAVAGAVADMSAFDPKQPRLSNLINDLVPALKNPLTDYLAAQEGDTDAEGRMKNAIEGLLPGVLLDTFIKVAKAMKATGGRELLRQAVEPLRGEAGAIRLGGGGELPKPQVADVPVSALQLDPQRFQYKVQQGEGGATGSLAGVQTYDPNLAGIIQVWTDPADGKTYVVNGHNRVDLARRLGAESVTVRYLQYATAEEARTMGALTNVAEGRGTAIDAAKLFRDTGLTTADLQAMGIPLRERIAADGLALANLDDSLFHDVVQGTLPLERAIVIGSRITDPDQQRKLVQMLEGKRVNIDMVRELADFVQEAPSAQVVQDTLFGAEETTVSLALDKARIAASIRERLATDKSLFAKVSKTSAAERLTEAGNIINISESERIATESAQLLEIFDRLKYRTGPISDILNDAAAELHAGGNLNDIRQRTYQRLSEALPEAIRGAETADAGRAAAGLSAGEFTTSTGDVLRADAERTRGAVSAAGIPIRDQPASVAPEASIFDQPPAGTPAGTPPGTPPRPPLPPGEGGGEPPGPPPRDVFTEAWQSPGRFNPMRQAASAKLRTLTAEINVFARDLGLMQEQTRGTVSQAETVAAARELVRTGQMSIERILSFTPKTILNDEEGTAARLIRDATLKRHDQLMRAATLGDATAQRQLITSMYLASSVEAATEAATGTEVARALAARRILSTPRGVSMADFQELLRTLRAGDLTPEASAEVDKAIADVVTLTQPIPPLGEAVKTAAAQELPPGQVLAGLWDIMLRGALAGEETGMDPQLLRTVLQQVQDRITKAVPEGYLLGGLWQMLVEGVARDEATINPQTLMGLWEQLIGQEQKQAFLDYYAHTSKPRRLINAFLEARAAGLLTTKSLLRNLVGNTATTVWAVPERAVIGAYSQTFGSGEVFPHEALDLLHGYWVSQKEALRLAGKALKTGESQVFQEFTKHEAPSMLPAISGDALGLTGAAGTTADVLGEVIRWPFRGLVSGDDYFKWVNYKAEQYALAYRDYRQRLASGATPEQAQAAYVKALADPPTWLDDAAQGYSLYQTFNDEVLNPYGQKFLELRNQEGPAGDIARFVVPFARTPLNVAGYGAERTPGLNFLSSHYYQEMRAGGARRDAAIGRLALGSATFMVLAGYAMNGGITGRGPKDPNLRKQYEDNGWKPYSAYVPGYGYWPYRGFEPLSGLLGQAADFAELVNRGAGWSDLMTLATSLVLSSTEYMEEQPMLKGVSDLIDAIEDPETRAPDVLQQLLGSALPLPGFQNLSRLGVDLEDPYLRETRGPHGDTRSLVDILRGDLPTGNALPREVEALWQELASRTPNQSNNLYPKRDRLYGEPLLRQGGAWALSPSAPSAQEPDPARTELNHQQIVIPPIPKSLGGGRLARSPLDPTGPDVEPVELSGAEWDRWQELSGTIRVEPDPRRPMSSRLLTLREYLNAYVETTDYQEKSDGKGGGKDREIHRIVRLYRDAAKEALFGEGGEFPRVYDALQEKAAAQEYRRMDKPEQARERRSLPPSLSQSLGR